MNSEPGEQKEHPQPPSKRFERNAEYERRRWTIFAVTWLAYAGFYLTRKSFSVAKIGILADPDVLVDKDMMALIDAGYLTAYAIGQFLWGMAGDRFGTRKIVLAGMFASIVFGFAMGVSSITLLFGVFFIAQGLCQSSGWAPLTKNVSYWFSRTERGRVYGWWSSNYAVGGMIASPYAGYMADHFLSWRYAFFMPAGTLLGIWFLFLFLQKNRPEDVGLQPIEDYHGEETTDPAHDESESDHAEGSWQAVLEVIQNPMVLLLGVVYFLLKPTRYAILFWGPVLINEKLGTSMGDSGLLSAVFELAGPLGMLFAGYVSDLLFHSRRIPVCVILLFLLSIVLFCFESLTSSGSGWMMGMLLFAIGFLLFGPDSLIVGTAAVDFGRKKGASTAVGLINGFGSTGAILGGALPGVISDRYGWGVLFSTFGAFTVIAALLLLPKWNAVPTSKDTKG